MCTLCRAYVQTEELDAHVKKHFPPSPVSSARHSDVATPSQHDETIHRAKRRCEPCNRVLWKKSWSAHIKSEDHRKCVEAAAIGAAQGSKSERVGSSGGSDPEDDIQVSHIEGRDFGRVGRNTATGAFPTTTLEFMVTKRRPQASLSLRYVDIVPIDARDLSATVTQKYAPVAYN